MVIKVNRKVPQIASLINTFGSFAEPFLNVALADENLGYEWKKYFVSLKFSWENENSLALDEINSGLRMCKKDKTLYYFLLSTKLSLLMKMKDLRGGDSIYIQLVRDEAKIPFVARKHVMTMLLNYRPISEIEEGMRYLRRVRTWSKKYIDDHSTQVFVLLGKAREKVKTERISDGFLLFLKSFRIAENIPHPLGITDSLNDMAWYTRNRHPYWSCGIAKRAMYWAGWYRENMSSIFYIFDTLFECQKISNDPQLWKSTSVMIWANEYLPTGSGWGTQEYYHDRIESCKQIIPNFRVSRYENTKELRTYLRAHMRSPTYACEVSGVGKANILAILNNKVKMVRGDTLRRLIIGLKIEVNLNNAPFQVFNEYIKMRIEDGFNKEFEKFGEVSEDQRQIEFISTYMAYFKRRRSIPYLSRKDKLKEAFDSLNDVEKFKEFMAKRYETMEFVNSMIKAHPFLQARKDLAREYLKRMTKRLRERFIKIYVGTYLNMKEGERKIIDRFIRDYIRYDIKWETKSILRAVPARLPIKEFIRVFHLKKTPAILAYYAVEGEKERKQLLSVLKKI